MSEYSLNLHMEGVHSDKTKVVKQKFDQKCKYCEKTFKCGSNLVEHEKVVHEEVYNFNCDQCSRKFFYGSKLRTHKITVHEKMKCKICKTGSYNKFELARHEQKVHGLRPEFAFKCDICQKCFKSENTLTYHKSKVHKD